MTVLTKNSNLTTIANRLIAGEISDAECRTQLVAHFAECDKAMFDEFASFIIDGDKAISTAKEIAADRN